MAKSIFVRSIASDWFSNFQHFSWIIVLLGNLQQSEVTGQSCGHAGRYAGLDAFPGSSSASLYTTVLLPAYGGINCYGIVSTWKFYSSGACSDVWFQIWRTDVPLSGIYRLIGQNPFYANDEDWEHCPNGKVGHVVQFDIPYDQQIPVIPGDIIGWTVMGTTQNFITYNTTLSANLPNSTVVQCILIPIPDVPGGTLTTSTNCSVVQTMYYSISAHIVAGPPPKFNNLPFTVSITERIGRYTSPNTPVFIAVASVPQNGHPYETDRLTMQEPVDLEYEIMPPVTGFKIRSVCQVPNGNKTKVLGCGGIVTIDTANSLDYEFIKQHTLNIVATSFNLSTYGTLTVNVLDINEIHWITNLPNRVNVSALTAKVGDNIFLVSIYDTDTNSSSIKYYLTHPYTPNPDDPAPPFKINPDSGAIYISSDLSTWVRPTSYEVVIEATDFKFSDKLILTVDILDTRTPPIIISLPNAVNISENTPNMSEIFQVVAHSRFPNELRYIIMEVSPFHMTDKFRLFPNGSICTTSSGPVLDYADGGQRNGIQFTVVVGDDVLYSGQYFLSVFVTWINQRPYFIPNSYHVSAPEECGQISGVPPARCDVPGLTINVDDRDLHLVPSIPESVVCFIMPSPGSMFFNLQNCATLLIFSLDIDSKPSNQNFNLTIVAVDALGLTSTCQVHVDLYYINDNSPDLMSPTSIINITENTAVGTTLLTFSASDDDSGYSARITFHLVPFPGVTPELEGTNYLEIDRYTGVLSVKRIIDYEVSKVLYFFVVASDNGDPPWLSTREMITAYILDINDNRPQAVCTDPYLNSSSTMIQCFFDYELPTSVPTNHLVQQFQSLDSDSATADNLSYYLLNKHDSFWVDAVSGSLLTNVTSSPLSQYYRYDLIVMAADQGKPALQQTPPFIGRVDAYPAAEHEITIATTNNFSTDVVLTALTECLRNVCRGDWYPRVSIFTPAVSLTDNKREYVFYVIEGNHTFYYENMAKSKLFVGRSDLLQCMRGLDVHGHPKSDFGDCMTRLGISLDDVNPTYPVWFIDTLAGRILAICLISAAITLLVVGIAVLICCRCQWCCFKPGETEQTWVTHKPPDVPAGEPRPQPVPRGQSTQKSPDVPQSRLTTIAESIASVTSPAPPSNRLPDVAEFDYNELSGVYDIYDN